MVTYVEMGSTRGRSFECVRMYMHVMERERYRVVSSSLGMLVLKYCGSFKRRHTAGNLTQSRGNEDWCLAGDNDLKVIQMGVKAIMLDETVQEEHLKWKDKVMLFNQKLWKDIIFIEQSYWILLQWPHLSKWENVSTSQAFIQQIHTISLATHQEKHGIVIQKFWSCFLTKIKPHRSTKCIDFYCVLKSRRNKLLVLM